MSMKSLKREELEEKLEECREEKDRYEAELSELEERIERLERRLKDGEERVDKEGFISDQSMINQGTRNSKLRMRDQLKR